MTALPPHLAIRPLTPQDVDQCVALETAGFPAEHRASRDKIAYRLRVCPELCLGLFVRTFSAPYAEGKDVDTLPEKLTIVSEKLVGHVIGTKIKGDVITDDDMAIPTADAPGVGHQEASLIVGVHLVVVDPEWQGKLLGTLLFHDYAQKLAQQAVGDKIVILAEDKLVGWYVGRLGFSDYGISDCAFGGTQWHDLGVELVEEQ